MKIALVLALFAFTTGCSHSSHKLREPVKHYKLIGSVLSLNSGAQTASIDAAAIPNYMDAMTMDYPIASSADFDKLHPGDKITGTLNVSASGDDYNLSDIRKQEPTK